MDFDFRNLIYISRIVIAGVCGILIGLERKNRSKEAGIRTHFVVACGSALIMIVSKYAFFDVFDSDGIDVKVDPSRVASTIASGIGFLGAGIIFIHKNTVTGLTTAAGIWATSGVGMAIGAGMYITGISAAVILITAQILLHINWKWMKIPKSRTLKINNVNETEYQKYITNLLREKGINIYDVSVEKLSENKTNYLFVIELPAKMSEEDVLALTPYSCSIK